MTRRPKEISPLEWKGMSPGARQVAESYWIVQNMLEKKFGKEQASEMGLALGTEEIVKLLDEESLD